MTTIVLGLGNPVCADDAVGLRVAEALAVHLAAQPVPGVRVVTSERAGFELLDLLTGADRAVIVDCLQIPGAVAGRARRLTPGELAGSARLVGSHDVSLPDVLELAATLGIPMPAEVEVIGIEAWDTGHLREGLSAEVAASVKTVEEMIWREIVGANAGQSELTLVSRH